MKVTYSEQARNKGQGYSSLQVYEEDVYERIPGHRDPKDCRCIGKVTA